jgi:F-type H+-transporting ATPase subunit b
VLASLVNIWLLAQEETEPVENLSPKAQELIVGVIAFAVLFAFMAKWVLPRLNRALEERRQKIQGDLEKAEETRSAAEQLLTEYRQQLAGARDEANRVIEEARQTADQLRRDLQVKAEREAQGIVARAQEEIRAERDRVFQELRGELAEISVELAGRVVGAELDRDRHARLIEDYIEQVARAGTGATGNGSRRGRGE